jgi:hypothetical protein
MVDKREERIKKLLENPNLNDWEKGFLASVNIYMEKYSRISNKQWALVQKVEANYSPEVIAQRQAWNDDWSDEKQFQWETALNYYKANPPYFSSMILRYEDGGTPTEKEYRKLVDNKYVQNVIVTIQSKPLYDVGCLVQVRRTAKGPHYRFRDTIALVVTNDGPVISAAKGSKQYSILPFGETAPIKIQERWLKKKRG